MRLHPADTDWQRLIWPATANAEFRVEPGGFKVNRRLKRGGMQKRQQTGAWRTTKYFLV